VDLIHLTEDRVADLSGHAIKGVGLFTPLLAGIADSNPTGGMDVCLFVCVVCSQVQVPESG